MSSLIYEEIYEIEEGKYSSREKGFFIIHNGKGKFDIYEKSSGNWYNGIIKFPYSLFNYFYVNPKIYYLKLKELYGEYKYLSLCTNCGDNYIVPARINICNHCYRENIEKDVKIKDIYPKKEHIVI